MSSKKDRIITVDGISYSLDTGKTIADEKKPAERPKVSVANQDAQRANVLDLRHFAPEPPEPSGARGNSNTPRQDRVHDIGGTVRSKNVEQDDGAQAEITKASVESDAEVSVPSDPGSSRHSTDVHFFHRVIVAPFTEKTDRYVVQGFLLSSMISPLFWLLALTPGIIVRLAGVQQYSVNDLLTQTRLLLDPANYYRIGLSAGLLIVLSAASILALYLVRSVARATRLRMIDHRPVRSKLLYAQAMSKSWRAYANWLLNLVLLAIMMALVAYGSEWLMRGGLPLIEANSTLAAIIILIVAIKIFSLIALRWSFSTTMVAATNKSLWFVQGNSWRLAFIGFAKNILSVLWFILVSAITGGLIGLISWAEISYLGSSQYKYMQVGMFVVGAVLMLAVLVAYRIWKNNFLASLYYSVVSSRGKAAMSSYLSLEKPAKKGYAPFVILASMAAVVALVSCVIIYLGHDKASGYMGQLREQVPASFEIKIPRPTK